MAMRVVVAMVAELADRSNEIEIMHASCIVRSIRDQQTSFFSASSFSNQTTRLHVWGPWLLNSLQ